MNTHSRSLLSRIFAATLKYGERGECIQKDSRITNGVYFTDTGICSSSGQQQAGGCDPQRRHVVRLLELRRSGYREKLIQASSNVFGPCFETTAFGMRVYTLYLHASVLSRACVCVDVCACACTSVQVHARVYTWVGMYMCACVLVCGLVQIRAPSHACACTHGCV
jgi:hypothetical protein